METSGPGLHSDIWDSEVRHTDFLNREARKEKWKQMIRLLTFTDDQMTKSADNPMGFGHGEHGADAVTIFGPDNNELVFRNVFLEA